MVRQGLIPGPARGLRSDRPVWRHETLHEGAEKGEFLTGLLYVNTQKPTIYDTFHIADAPLVHLHQAA